MNSSHTPPLAYINDAGNAIVKVRLFSGVGGARKLLPPFIAAEDFFQDDAEDSFCRLCR